LDRGVIREQGKPQRVINQYRCDMLGQEERTGLYGPHESDRF
jgi:hypothetical protein